MRRPRHARHPRRAPVRGVVVTLAVVAATVGSAGCGGAGGTANQAATATTFGIDTTTVSAMKTLVDEAHVAATLAASGRGANAVAACTTAWNRVRAGVAAHDTKTASAIDGALSALSAAVRTRDTAAAADAADTVGTAAARYTKLYP